MRRAPPPGRARMPGRWSWLVLFGLLVTAVLLSRAEDTTEQVSMEASE